MARCPSCFPPRAKRTGPAERTTPMTQTQRGNLIVVSAPSGAGKTTIVETLIARTEGISRTISHTTRAPRPGERDGVDYHFIDDAKFEAMIEADDFVEHAGVFGRQYGTAASEIESRIAQGVDAIAVIDWQGARNIRRKFADAVTVFVMPPSIELLAERLSGRGTDSDAEIAKRLAEAEAEASHRDEFDYLIINDVLEDAVHDLDVIVRAARLRILHAAALSE